MGPKGDKGDPGANGPTLPIGSFTTATFPAAAVAYLNTFAVKKDPGAQAQLYWCGLNAAGAYVWVLIGTTV